MTISSLSSSTASALLTPPKSAAPADSPHDGDGDDAAQVQAKPPAGTGSKVDVTA